MSTATGFGRPGYLEEVRRLLESGPFRPLLVRERNTPQGHVQQEGRPRREELASLADGSMGIV